ncbi:MAG TPA: HAD hydrolase-like protein, partial [Tepidiformaceae bacterium]|nr:HAD hydrolase-like protein [Tepidiformaceae bacterium]
HCLMVGDRIDNDVAPARALGMRAIRFRTGRHARQEPRSWEEAPDEDVASVGELRDAIWRVLYS